jgi:hypothetical protein
VDQPSAKSYKARAIGAESLKYWVSKSIAKLMESRFAMLLQMYRCECLEVAKASKHAMEEKLQWQGFEK